MMFLTTGRERDSVPGLPLEQVWQVVRQPVDFSGPSAAEVVVVVAAGMEMAWAAVEMTLGTMMKKALGLKSRRAGAGK